MLGSFDGKRFVFLLFFFCVPMGCVGNAADKPEDQVYPSPDGKWEVRSTWVSDDFRRDVQVINRETGKSYFGLQGAPESGFGAKYIYVLWSPDSRFAAIVEVYGRIASSHYLVAIQNGIPVHLGEVWEKAAPDKEEWPCCLLKEKDKKRWSGVWQSADADPICFGEWLSNRDLEIKIQFSTDLQATKKESLKRLRVSTTITLRMDDKGGARIIAGKYDRYEKTSKGTPADWDAEDKKNNCGRPGCIHY
ncbi:MAG: hypothetical protein WCO68_09090 [Verrucomicrobiota bacterium]